MPDKGSPHLRHNPAATRSDEYHAALPDSSKILTLRSGSLTDQVVMRILLQPASAGMACILCIDTAVRQDQNIMTFVDDTVCGFKEQIHRFAKSFCPFWPHVKKIGIVMDRKPGRRT